MKFLLLMNIQLNHKGPEPAHQVAFYTTGQKFDQVVCGGVMTFYVGKRVRNEKYL